MMKHSLFKVFEVFIFELHGSRKGINYLSFNSGIIYLSFNGKSIKWTTTFGPYVCLINYYILLLSYVH